MTTNDFVTLFFIVDKEYNYLRWLTHEQAKQIKDAIVTDGVTVYGSPISPLLLKRIKWFLDCEYDYGEDSPFHNWRGYLANCVAYYLVNPKK